MFFKRRPEIDRNETQTASTAETLTEPNLSAQDFQNDVMSRLAGIEQLLSHIKSKLDAPGKPESYARTFRLTEIKTETMKIVAVYDAHAGAHEKWDIRAETRLGATIRISTFDKNEADKAKAAKAKKVQVQVTYGKNRNDYYDLIGVNDGKAQE